MGPSRAAYIYFIETEDGQFVRIGYSAQASRLFSFQSLGSHHAASVIGPHSVTGSHPAISSGATHTRHSSTGRGFLRARRSSVHRTGRRCHCAEEKDKAEARQDPDG